MKIELKLFFSLLFILICLCSNSQILNFNSDSISQLLDQEYEQIISDEDVVGASIVIVDDGEVTYAKGFGYEDRENRIKANSETIYRIGSSTKTFTAIAIMQLQEKRLLNVNESIRLYIPELKIENRFSEGDDLLIKDILAHVSGLPSDIYNGFLAHNVPDINWVIEQLGMQTTISSSQYTDAYSNIGYAMLGELISRVSGIPYEKYIELFILNPLEMKSSKVDLQIQDLSKAYVNGEIFQPPLIRDKAAGSITGSVADMGNFIKMLLSDGNFKDKIIASEYSVNEMEQSKQSSLFLFEDHTAYGYGLQMNKIVVEGAPDIGAGTLIGHGGDVIAFHGDYKYIPELNVGAVILTNTDNGSKINDADEILEIYLNNAKGISFSIEYNDIENDVNKLIAEEDLLGTYNFGDAIMEVENVDKIKFKIDGTKVVLNRINSSNSYSVKIYLLGFIPIKSNSMQLKFEKIGDNIFIKQIGLKRKREEYVAQKVEKRKIPSSWKEKLGKYKIINEVYDCSNCTDWNYKGATAEIREDSGVIVFELYNEDIDGIGFLNLVSDSLAVSGGIGRDSGETIRLLANGNIYYSGFELSKY